MKKRAISFVLLLVALCVLIPQVMFNTDAEVITQASFIRGSDFTNSKVLADKLNAIFGGNASIYSNWNCTNRVNTALGTYSVPNNGETQYVGPYGSYPLNQGTSCWIYANGVYYTLFGEALGNGTPGANSHLIDLSRGTSRLLTYENMCMWGVHTGVGAQVRVGLHSLVVLSYDSERLVYIDGNGDGNGLVAVRSETWGQVRNNYNTRNAVQYIVQPNSSYMEALYPGHDKNIREYAEITEGKYALKCTAIGTYAAVQDNVDVAGQNILTTTARTGFEIKKSTTTEGYSIRPLCSVGGKVNVYTDYVTSGNNVCLWDDTGHVSQRWYFEAVSGGYAIRSVQTPSCALTVDERGNIIVSTYTGADSQIWSLETFCTTHKYSAATCTKPKTCKVCGVTSGKALGHSYTNACDTTCNRTGCKATRAIAHNYAAATCTKAKTCKVCGVTSGKALGHSYQSGKCIRCNHTPKKVKITTQPKSVRVVKGKTAKVTVKASGTGLKYTWYHRSASAIKYSKSSVTGATYSVKMSSSVNGRYVYCVVTDKYGNSVKTSVVRLYQGNTAKITAQPVNAAVKSGKTAKVTVKATGDGLKYTWYYAKKGSSKFKKSSVSSAAYTVKMSSSVNGRKVYCVITDQYGTSVKTKTVTLYKGTPAKITTQPKNVTIASGKTGKLTVKASGSGLKYTWYAKNKGAASFTKVGKNSKTYSFKMASKLNGCQVYCVVKDKYGTVVKSTVVTIKLAAKVKITKQPSSAYAVSGSTAKITVKATGEGLKYTWYYANRWADKWTKSSVTSATYSVKMSSKVNYRSVYCVVKDKYGNSVKSDVAILFNTDHFDKVVGSWTSTYRINSDFIWGPDFDCRLEIDSKGSVYVCIPDRVTMSTGIEFIKKVGNKYYYQMMEGPEYLQHNSTPYDDGLVDVIYDASTGSLELQFDYGCTVFFERSER